MEVALVRADGWWGQREAAFRIRRGSGMRQPVGAPLDSCDLNI